MTAGGPSGRRRLRAARRWLAALGWAGFLAAGVTVALAATDALSPLVAAGVLYAATVAYGLGEMAKLRERVLFGPVARAAAPAAARWWIPRVVLVLAVGALPAVLLLGGLAGRS